MEVKNRALFIEIEDGVLERVKSDYIDENKVNAIRELKEHEMVCILRNN